MSEVVDLRAIEQHPTIAEYGMPGALAQRNTDVRRLVGEIRALREATQRIVTAVGDYYDDLHGTCRVGCSQCCDHALTVGDLRRASQVLKRISDHQ